ncbi:MAG: ABC transporter permease [Kofleriaceae bacterium]
MRAGPWLRIVGRNALRNRARALTSVFGIVVGIGFFVLFLASTEKIGAVLAKVFPLDEVEVVAPQATLLGADVSKRLDAHTVELIAARPEVVRAVPRMSLAFPATGDGNFEGQALSLKIDGSADGVDPAHVVGDPSLSPADRDYLDGLFQDWLDPARRGTPVACVPPPPGQRSSCPKPDRQYCDATTRTCEHRVPVVLSPAMLQLYNTQFAKANGTPLVDADFAKFMLARGGLERMRFTLQLGGGSTGRSRAVEAVLVGISAKAKPIGMTVPIQYIERWNREFVGDDAGKTFSSIVVTLAARDQVAVFSQWLRDGLDLRVEDSVGERLATVVLVMRVVLILIAGVILLISAVSIAHTFFMLVAERRRELGLMRAVGATRTQVRSIVLGEAVVLGVLGGVLGVGLSLALAALVDGVVGAYTPNFPFKPDTWTAFKPWMIGGGIAIGALFAMIGGYLPARRAARMEPATALSQD